MTVNCLAATSATANSCSGNARVSSKAASASATPCARSAGSYGTGGAAWAEAVPLGGIPPGTNRNGVSCACTCAMVSGAARTRVSLGPKLGL